MSDWLEETLHPHFRIALAKDRVLHDSRTEHQHLVIFENGSFGRVMMLDGVIQTAERDEFIYHEMLSHVPIMAHGDAKSVLIIGGGDGGMLEEVLKHSTVERVTMVEVDRQVVDLARRYLSETCRNAFDDPRTNLVIADGKDFVRTTDERFDVQIIDSTDPVGPGAALFEESFYADCRRCQAPGGILVTQNGVPFLQADELRSTCASLRRHFQDVSCYLATIPTYVGGPMAFGWASNDPSRRDVAPETLASRWQAAGIATRYYTPAIHRAAFVLPPYIVELAG